MSRKTLISVVGQTALGKTKLAVALARQFDTEIISADSRQFYKEMSIGTAVPSKEELQIAPHHFIHHKSIFEDYSVGDFERDGLELLDRLFKQKDIVVLVGGSGLYIDAITKGLDDFPEVPHEIREALKRTLANQGIEALQQRLSHLDPQHYEQIDLNNPHRLIRALEICIATGRPFSSFLTKKKKPRPFNSIVLGLMAPREIVYRRINERVDKMMEEGLLEEARSLYRHKRLNALQTVGYKELFNHIDGSLILDEAISEIKKNTRRFAKRQKTWFKKNEKTIWVDYNYNMDKLVEDINSRLNE